MNGNEARKRSKEVFEKKDSTLHQKVDALFLLVLHNSDSISSYAWIQIPVRARGPVKIVISTWALIVTVASIERIWAFVQNLLT